MQIVNRTKFLELPAGTVYSFYKPSYFEGLEIKGETWTNDWLLIDLVGNVKATGEENLYDILEAAEEGERFDLDFQTTRRDGVYDPDQLFAIYEIADLQGLIETLQQAAQFAH